MAETKPLLKARSPKDYREFKSHRLRQITRTSRPKASRYFFIYAISQTNKNNNLASTKKSNFPVSSHEITTHHPSWLLFGYLVAT